MRLCGNESCQFYAPGVYEHCEHDPSKLVSSVKYHTMQSMLSSWNALREEQRKKQEEIDQEQGLPFQKSVDAASEESITKLAQNTIHKNAAAMEKENPSNTTGAESNSSSTTSSK